MKEIIDLVFDKLEMLVILGLIGAEVWYYFIIPGLRELRDAEKKRNKNKDSE